MNPYYLSIAVSRIDVKYKDTSSTIRMLNQLFETPERALTMRENLGFSFSGYDDDIRELWEIPEVRDFVSDLDDAFPYWLYFLSKFDTGLQAIFLCLMPLVKPESRNHVFPKYHSELLMGRWLPAMNKMCEYTNIEGQALSMTERAISYLVEGPFGLGRNNR